MTRTIRLFAVSGNKTLGTATLTDGEVAYDDPAVEAVMAPWVARFGAGKAFDWFADWSNGYVSTKESTPAPTAVEQATAEPTVAAGSLPAADDAAMASEPDGTEEVDRWRGLIAPFDQLSGDGRLFVSPSQGGEWDVRQLPRPASWAREDSMGHMGAVTVARMVTCQVTPAGFQADGDWMESVPETCEAKSLMDNSVLYPSVDVDDYEYDFVTRDGKSLSDLTDEEIEEFLMAGQDPVMAFRKGRIVKVTFLAAEAFPQTTLEFYQGPPSADRVADAVEDEMQEVEVAMPAQPPKPPITIKESALVASASGNTSLPVAPRDTSWDGSGARSRMLSRAKGGGDTADAKMLGQGFFYRDDSADPKTVGAYGLPFADVIGGDLKMVYSGVSSAAGRLDQTQMPDSDKAAVRSKIEAAYRACAKAFDDPTIKAPWLNDSGGDSAVEGQTFGAPTLPPEGWFADPQLTELTPITVTAEGQLFGHLADRDCHMAYLSGGQCVLPPDEGGFEWFHRGEIETEQHTFVAVGLITASTSHPDLKLNASRAAAHYDETGTQVAVVRAGRDKFGTWVAGSVVPEATAEQVQLVRRSPLSGDWRVVGGKRELVAALAVNVPGFPVVRGRSSKGRAVSLVASGWDGWKSSDGTRRFANDVIEAAVNAEVARRMRIAASKAEADRIAASIGRDTKSVLAELEAAVHGGQ